MWSKSVVRVFQSFLLELIQFFCISFTWNYKASGGIHTKNYVWELLPHTKRPKILDFKLDYQSTCLIFFFWRRWILKLQETEIGLLGRMTQQIFFLDLFLKMKLWGSTSLGASEPRLLAGGPLDLSDLLHFLLCGFGTQAVWPMQRWSLIIDSFQKNQNF